MTQVTLVLTHQCNMRCTYCYAGDKFDRAMSERVGWKALADAFSADGTGLVTVGFFGGEPLMRFDRLLNFTRVARRLSRRTGRPVAYTVTTNGTLLTERHLRFFASHGFHVGLSMDGLKEAHDRYRPMASGRSSFDLTWRKIELAARWLERLNILMVVSPQSVDALPESLRRLRNVGVARVTLIPNVDFDWTPQDRRAGRQAYREAVRLYLETRETNRPLFVHPFVELRRDLADGGGAMAACGFGDGEMAVAPSGRIYPCARLVGDDTRHGVAIGHVFGGLSRPLVEGLRASAQDRLERCGAEGSCRCVPHMPGYTDARGERLAFLQSLAVDVCRDAMRVGV